MTAIDVALRLLEIVFPSVETSRRRTMAQALLSGAHHPPSAVDDTILRSVDGHALFAYRDAHVRAAIHSLKYEGNAAIASWFADHAEDIMARIIADTHGQHTILVPIPVSVLRRIERGYNQSALFARALASRFAHDCTCDETLMVRRVFTQSQTKARTRAERAKNIHGAFEYRHHERIRGSSIVLIDDVITTGATIREAARTMRAAGARSVRCLAIAH